jgi:hypothetical protein
MTLPPSVEERLSGWMRIKERYQPQTPAKARPRPTVTISRQFGCEGFPLALQLQKLFEQASGEPWSIFDKELIERVARDEQISLQLLSHLEEPVRFLEAYGFHPRGKVTTDEAFAKIAVHLIHFAKEGNAIIVGRGGSILCQPLDNCFHFRLEAGLEWRLGSLVRRLGLTRKAAADLEKSQTKARDHFVREHLGVNGAEQPLYDAVFSNERHGVEAIAAAILGYVKCGWKGESLKRSTP